MLVIDADVGAVGVRETSASRAFAMNLPRNGDGRGLTAARNVWIGHVSVDDVRGLLSANTLMRNGEFSGAKPLRRESESLP